MVSLRVMRALLSVFACLASINSELGLPLSRKLRLLDSLTLVWSFFILCTSLAKFFAKDLALNATRGANYKQSNAPNLNDLVLMNYLPRINEFEKLYYGLVSVSIGTSLFWRLYLRFYRPTKSGICHSDAKRKLMHFFYEGPPANATVAAAREPEVTLSGLRPEKVSNESLSTVLSSVVHLEWVKLFECQAVIRDLAGCSQESIRRDELSKTSFTRRPNPLSTSHGKRSMRTRCKSIIARKKQTSPKRQELNRKLREDEDDDDEIFLNPVRSHNFLQDYTWNRWNYIARSLGYMLLFISSLTIPILHFTIVGLYSVMINFSYEKLDSRAKLTLYCYGVLEQVYACTQAALFFIFTNIFIIIFYADIRFKINAIERDLRDILVAMKQQIDHRQVPRILINYQQLRLWAFFDHIDQVDRFVSKYSVVSMSTFIIGLSFGQSFLKVEEPALKTGTAAVLFANFMSFSFLYAISWDIERRSSRVHSVILSIASHDCNFLIKRLWLKTLFGFFERDGKRTFTLANRYPLNLHSYFKTVFGWLTMSLLINRLFHKHSWESTSSVGP